MPGLGLGLAVNPVAVRRGSPYTAETLDIFSRMTTPPTTTRKDQIDTLIRALKLAGVWSKLDVLHVFAAHDAQAACLNWKSSSFNAAPVNAPTFTVDRGYTGDGAAAYVETGATHNGLPNFTLNSAHASVWTIKELNGPADYGIGLTGGSNYFNLGPRVAGNFLGRINDSITLTVAQASSLGMTTLNRSGATARQIYRNGSSIGSDTQVSVVLQSSTMAYLRSFTVYSLQQVAFGSFGASLSPAEEMAKYTAVLAYMQAVGAA